MEENDKKIFVTMLDGFSMSYGAEAISVKTFGNSKMLELLQIFFCYSKNGISRNQLIDMLYDETVQDKNHSLDSVVYRLKQTFEKAGLPSGNYIQIKNGIYSWSSMHPIEVDAVEFITAMNELSEYDESRQMEVLERFFHSYKKELLSGRPERPWLTEMREQLHTLYTKCIHELGKRYIEQKRYEELYDMYSKAVELYPYDEWQDGQLVAMQYLGRFDKAYDIYVNTVKKYEKDFGLPLNAKVLTLVEQMGHDVLNSPASIDVVMDQLTEKEAPSGAFYCSYPSFIDAYRYISRQIERSGQSVFFMICEFIYLNPMGQKSPRAGDALKEAIGMSLRKGDSYTKYSNSQFMILLMGAKNENCEMIFNRIRRLFKKKNRNANCDLEYFVYPVQNTVEQNDVISFRNNKARWNN